MTPPLEAAGFWLGLPEKATRVYRGMKRCHCQKSACVGGWRFLQKRFSGSGFAATSGAPKVGSIIGTGNGHTDRRGRLIRHGKVA